MGVKYVHTNIIAQDWKLLARFYISVFDCVPKPPERDLSGDWLDGLTGVDAAHISGMHLVLPGFGHDGPTLEIFQYDQNVANLAKAINVEGFGHIAFAVSDVDAYLQRIIDHGGSALGRVVRSHVSGVGMLHVVYARDPEGNIIEVQKWSE